MELLSLFTTIYTYHSGLKKICFCWYKLPKNINVLAVTDYTGLFIYNNTRYYVSADQLNNITIERD
jgi:hypothetical protein